jgi:uncharacterized protein
MTEVEREVDAHFAHGRAPNWFGGTSNASTQLLDAMHYRGMLRIAGRVSGVRTYAVALRAEAGPEIGGATQLHSTPQAASRVDAAQAVDALVDVIVHKYAPLPEASLRQLMALLLRGGAPQWGALRLAAFARAKQRLASAVVDGTTWYWPRAESPTSARYAAKDNASDTVRLLAPFDPLVWDRRRFELLWGWAYRFEAYTPAPKRVRGYYAQPLLWRDQVIGWGNVSLADGVLSADLGYVAGKAPREAAFKQALAEELDRMQKFLLPKK